MANYNRAVASRIASKKGLPFPDEPNASSLPEDDDFSGADDRTPESSLARSGAPQPRINPGPIAEDNSDDLSVDDGPDQEDSYMPAPQSVSHSTYNPLDDLTKQQMILNQTRPIQKEADYSSNLARALMPLTRGTDKPVDDPGYFTQLEGQSKEYAKQSEGDIARRQAVMKAVQQQQILAQKNKELNDYRTGTLENQRERTRILQQNADSKTDKSGNKANDAQAKVYNALAGQLESTRSSSPAVSQAEKDLYASDKIHTLIERSAPDGDLNKLGDAQVNTLIMEVAKMASGGQASEAELHALKPDAVPGRFAKLWGQYANEPTAANAGKFIQQYVDYADGLRSDAQEVIKDRYGRMINAKKSQLTPEQVKDLEDNYINRFEAKNQKKSSAAPKHAPGTVVTVYGKKYVVGADGDTLEPQGPQ